MAETGLRKSNRRFSNWITGWFTRPPFYRIDAERLKGAIRQFSVCLKSLETSSESPGAESWFDRSTRYLAEARQHQEAKELNAAWSALKSAERELIGGIRPEAVLVERNRVAAEADKKLDGWRRKAADLVWPAGERRNWPTEATKPTEDIAQIRAEILAVRKLVDEAADNMYWKQDYRRSQMKRSAEAVFVMLLTTVVVIAVVLASNWKPEEAPLLIGDTRSLVVVVTLGGLGASLSGLLTVLQRDLSQSIPEIKAQWTLVRFRPIIGAASAIGVVGVLQSGIGGLSVEPQAAVIAAFLAGFSERVVSSALAKASSNL